MLIGKCSVRTFDTCIYIQEWRAVWRWQRLLNQNMHIVRSSFFVCIYYMDHTQFALIPVECDSFSIPRCGLDVSCATHTHTYRVWIEILKTGIARYHGITHATNSSIYIYINILFFLNFKWLLYGVQCMCEKASIHRSLCSATVTIQ